MKKQNRLPYLVIIGYTSKKKLKLYYQTKNAYDIF